jgi:hypothetical protein
MRLSRLLPSSRLLAPLGMAEGISNSPVFSDLSGLWYLWHRRPPPKVLLTVQPPFIKLRRMATYSAILGHRIEVTYRAGDIVLPATGTLAADSGKSVFLEERYQQKGTLKTFRWEIPYACIIEIREIPEIPSPSASVAASPVLGAEHALEPAKLQLKNRPA